MAFKMGKFKERFDPKRTPTWKKMQAIAKQKYETMGEAEKKDAELNMHRNDMNLPGFNFYPPPLLFSNGIGDGQSTELLQCGHQWVTKKISHKGETSYHCKYGHEYGSLPDQTLN